MTATTPERLDQRAAHTLSKKRRAPARAVSAAILMSFLAIALVAAQEATPGSTPAATPSASATPTADMPRLELELEELNDSGIGGTVTLYDAGDQVIVEFDAEGAGGDHPSHIHAGVCGELDPEPAFPLENVGEDGESATVVDTTLDELLAEDYAIDLHLTPDQLGTLIACVNIDGEPSVPDPAASTPESTPETTPETTGESDGTGGTTGEEISDGTTGAEATDEQIAQADDPATETTTENTTESTTETAAETPEPTAATTIPQPPSGGDDGTGGAVAALPKPEQPVVGGDGTAGISGKGGPVATSSLPQQAGVGAALVWPTEPATAAIWASAAGAVILGAAALVVRRGEHHTSHTPSRWSRLGI